jgi:periodic tryptophan protein 1
MTAEIEKNLENLDLEKYDQEDNDLIFTTELEMLKPKTEKDSEMANAEEGDEDIEEASSESVSSFGDGETGNKRGGRRNKDYPEELEDSEEEKEDYTIRKTDSLIVAATAEDEHSNLEVYVYDHKTSDLYVHHEIILSSYPLCIEWLNNFRGENVNYVIVGSFLPQIEIWDLNREDCEPLYTLGGADEQTKKKKKKVLKLNKTDDSLSGETSHTDAVMSLSLNPF